MPRIARVVAIDLPHHITQRGNYQQNIFSDNKDREIYLAYINEASEKYDLTTLAYCLMDNHVHFIVVPHNAQAMAKTFNTAHMRYSQYYNKKQGVKGHLWQGRFYSCILSEVHLVVAARYVERNPVRAKKAKNPGAWEYSSAIAHSGGQERFLSSVKKLFNYIDSGVEQWREYIQEKDKEDEVKGLEKHTMDGRPWGNEKFVCDLEKKFDRRLRALPWGRPGKDK